MVRIGGGGTAGGLRARRISDGLSSFVTLPSSMRVYGSRGAANRSCTLPPSRTLPRSITTTSCAISATTPMSWVMNITVMPRSA